MAKENLIGAICKIHPIPAEVEKPLDFPTPSEPLIKA
jgi:hypothetical protein